MKTTLNIDDGVMARLKQEAARRGETMSSLVEAALRLLLEPKRPAKRSLSPLPRFSGGVPAVDVSNRDALREAMGGR